MVYCDKHSKHLNLSAVAAETIRGLSLCFL